MGLGVWPETRTQLSARRIATRISVFWSANGPTGAVSLLPPPSGATLSFVVFNTVRSY